MIFSASRRTDIPAFYAEWFVPRVRAGYCEVPNPMNPRQIARVSLRPEEVDLVPYGVKRGKCIDDELLGRLFGTEVCHKKDGTQRSACGCVQSRDIGIYNSCLFGCAYCYATASFTAAAVNHRRHDLDSAAPIPCDHS